MNRSQLLNKFAEDNDISRKQADELSQGSMLHSLGHDFLCFQNGLLPVQGGIGCERRIVSSLTLVHSARLR